MALAAAHQAQEAAAELIRFVREGPHYRCPPFGDDVQVVEKLADALKLALEVENAEVGRHDAADDAEMRNQLLGAVSRFLEGWAE
ncbi:MAG TPA: hypothetical protein VFJ46_17690 [Xanthobacteraceae bacterium]|nr:hypothetical protein [Xanthobacteraceae bacterium]